MLGQGVSRLESSDGLGMRAHASQVGYNIRFESLSTPETKILYLTDGMLFREILVDPLLSRCVHP